MNQPTRRQVLTASSVGAAAAAIGAARATPVTSRKTPVRRQNIWALSENSSVVQGYKTAVAAMKQLSQDRPNDPRGWRFQANIHGVPTDEWNNAPAQIRPYWRQCRHGHWRFLPWHRGYLYFFERIVRHFSGDPTWALPYWNWANRSANEQRAIPRPFRSPASEENPLWAEQRDSNLNHPQSPGLLPSVLANDVDVALGHRRYIHVSPNQPGFGGIEHNDSTSSPNTNFHVGLEFPAHDSVHSWIGGLMGNTRTSARDPIFWLHHANIDRVWERWRRLAGHADPDLSAWNRTYTFFDETSDDVTKTRTITIADLLDTSANPLNYVYDDYQHFAPALAQGAAVPNGQQKKTAQAFDAVASVSARSIELSDRPSVLTARLNPAAKAPIEALRSNPTREEDGPIILLSLEGVEYKTKPSGVYNVFINLPAGSANCTDAELHRVGGLSFFGDHGDDHGAQPKQGHDDPTGSVFQFDASHVVRSLARLGRWQDDALRLTFIADDLTDRARKGSFAVTIKKVALYVTP
jgi:hypothetical protein